MTHHGHVDAISVAPSMLEIFFESLSQRIRNLMKTNKFSDSIHLSVVPRSSGIKPLDYRTHISKYGSVHKC